METIVSALAENPLLLLFTVAALGFPLGRIKVAGASLGNAAVLFMGLAIGAVDPRLKLPDIVYLLGLTIFVYTIGLSSASGFFTAFDRRGLRDTALALGSLASAGLLAYLLAVQLGLPGVQASGMYSGAFTNASGLASVVDAIKAAGGDAAVPVVAYSLAYPVGVLAPSLVMSAAKAAFRVDLTKEALTIPSFRRSVQRAEVRTILVTKAEAEQLTVLEIGNREGHEVVFGRVRRDGEDVIARGDLRFRLGDQITVVGPAEEIERIAACLGEESAEAIQLDRTEFDIRRIFVSKAEVVGRPLRALELPQKEAALVTRVRRGDMEFIPNGDTVLELGDRVRVLTRRDNMDRISKFFGDSYRALSEVDFLTFSLGIGLGLLVGLIPIPLPGGITFRLGFAGGPLVVALILGRLERTGPIVWHLPYSANLTLRQLGLMLFAAGIGTRAGYSFYSTLAAGQGLGIFLTGAALTLTSGLLTMVIGHKLLKIPLNVLFGIYAGAQTQPISLTFATAHTKNDLPTNAYATIFPLATIFKIVVAQALLGAVGR